jgi:tetratricopeptide (TPR) repeat protein
MRRSLLKALALAPALGEAWLGRGLALNALERYPEALNAFDRAAASTPNLVEVWLGRGKAFYGLNRYDEALVAYKKALTLKPNLAETLADYGKIYDNRGLALKPDKMREGRSASCQAAIERLDQSGRGDFGSHRFRKGAENNVAGASGRARAGGIRGRQRSQMRGTGRDGIQTAKL